MSLLTQNIKIIDLLVKLHASPFQAYEYLDSTFLDVCIFEKVNSSSKATVHRDTLYKTDIFTYHHKRMNFSL